MSDLPGGLKPIYLVVALVVGLGIGAVVVETMDRRNALLVAALIALVMVGAMYELWLRLRR